MRPILPSLAWYHIMRHFSFLVKNLDNKMHH